MVALPKAALDDSHKQLLLIDFAGGLNTNTGAYDLASNETPDCLNVIPFPGRLQYRGGYTLFCALPGAADGALEFFDSNGNRHYAVWSMGNLYDCVSGSAVLIAAGKYIAGQQIGNVADSGSLYYSTITTTLRKWNPVAATEAAVTGSYPIPASAFLTLYAGSLIALAPTLSGTRFANEFVWSNVNDPTTWLPANAQQVGGLEGGPLNFIAQMGVSNSAVAPSRQLIVSKQNGFIYSYQGALGTLQESVVSSAVGLQDGRSGVFVPINLGAIVFLGQDFQIYSTDGNTATQISLKINNSFYTAIQNAVVSGAFFQGAYNERFQYYIIDIGNNTQYIYRWETSSWSKFQGWPSGYWMNGVDVNGFPTLFVAATGGTPGLYETSLDNQSDNGNMPSIYYTTPYLHGGVPNREKEYQWIDLSVINTPLASYSVNGQGLPRLNNTMQTMGQLILAAPAPASSSLALIWGVGEWGVNYWGLPVASTTPSVVPIHGPIMVPVPVTRFTRPGLVEPLRSGAAQFTIAADGSVPTYDVDGIAIRYAERGFRFVGAAKYDTEDGIIQTGTDPYVPLRP